MFAEQRLTCGTYVCVWVCTCVCAYVYNSPLYLCYLVKSSLPEINKTWWTLDKPTISLFTCYLERVTLDGNLFWFFYFEILNSVDCQPILTHLITARSICADYVTEKVWERLNLDIVPIVLGGANYSQLLPPHSYIDVRDFASPAALARHLANVDRNDTLYNSYFAWRQHYQCWGELPGFVDPCSVCDYLHRQRGRRQVVSDVSVFWSPSRCTPPQQYYAGIADIRWRSL